ncbi:helix-turn-helix domain-containing protein [Bacillus sp. 1P02SD]|uniref:helix-turn-helix domain-containing protein n=1 Tax=Bacillus sp. 1P02SD TaxID=3132264 RepID=UPI00399EF9C8
MNLKSNIEELIIKSGLRDEVFREALGVKQHQLRKIKKGESYPTVPKLFILAKLLNCKTDDLYEVLEGDEE